LNSASESKHIYNQAHLFLALESIKAKNYKKGNSTLTSFQRMVRKILGVGKAFHADERLQDYLTGL